jgi:capsular exopolysaccharide synthesis family protein
VIPQADAAELELRDYLDVVRRRKWLIAGVTALVVAASLAVSLLQTKVYQATSEVLLQPRASEQIFTSDNQSGQRDQNAVPTEIEVMRSRSVEQAVARELGRAPHVTIAAKGQTSVVRISASNTQPAEAAREANTFAGGFIKTRRQQAIDDLLAAGDQVQATIGEIDTQLAGLDAPIEALTAKIQAAAGDQRRELQAEQDRLRADAVAQRQALQTQRAGYSAQLSQLQLAGNLTRTGGAQLVSAAVVPSAPIRPTPKRNAILALVVGLLLGVGVAFLRDYLDETIKSKEDLERATGGLTVLGLIPVVAGWKDGDEPQIVAMKAPSSQAAEAYRTLRTSVRFLGLDRPIQLLQLTSATAAEGKTTTLANLAVTMASAGNRVVAVCCDLRRPRLHEFFELENKVGFTSVLVGEETLERALQPVPDQPRLSVLSAGPTPANPAELLSSPRVKALFDELRGSADIVLIDSPPILPVTDGLILSGLVDATIVVATTNRTSRKDLHRTLELLGQMQANVVGSVLNGVDPSRTYGLAYGDRSGRYGYGATKH